MSSSQYSLPWYCVNRDGCSTVLGQTIGGELVLDKHVTGDHVKTSASNLEVTCPDCGSKKIWYTSDQITRAVYQLIDTTVSVTIARMLRQLPKSDPQ